MENENKTLTKVLLFSGAGLSCPLGLPTTNGFNNVIDKGNGSVKALLKYYLGGNNFYDIEAVLSTVEELNTDGLLYKYLENNKGNSTYNSVLSSVQQLRLASKQYEKDLKKSVHDLLKIEDTRKAANLYYNLLKEVKSYSENVAISFFTANYDLSFEDSFEEELENQDIQQELNIASIDYGFITKGRKTIFAHTKDYEWQQNVIEYKKIHGSLGWYIDAQNRVTCSFANNTPDNPDSVPMLYPGFKGVPSREPFISLHNQFLQRLLSADIAIFMGFAFRDPYINTLIEMALQVNKNLKILCYNPAEISSLPSESRIKYLNTAYKEQFKYVQQPVEIVENPLKLSSQLK